MAHKKIQLSEIRVKSFVTTVSKVEQKTAKGGYSHQDTAASFSPITTEDTFFWTELKTRVSDNDTDMIKVKQGF